MIGISTTYGKVYNFLNSEQEIKEFKIIKSVLEDKIKNFIESKNMETQLDDNDYITLFKTNKNSETFEVTDIAKSFQSISRSNYFLKTQKWLGHIIELNGNEIIARLDDLNNPTTYEIAEFDIDDVPYEDRELVSLGAGFYWSIGKFYDSNGQLENKSLIRFQRTKPWEEKDLDNLVDDVDNLFNKLNKWE